MRAQAGICRCRRDFRAAAAKFARRRIWRHRGAERPARGGGRSRAGDACGPALGSASRRRTRDLLSPIDGAHNRPGHRSGRRCGRRRDAAAHGAVSRFGAARRRDARDNARARRRSARGATRAADRAAARRSRKDAGRRVGGGARGRRSLPLLRAPGRECSARRRPCPAQPAKATRCAAAGAAFSSASRRGISR